MEANLCLGFLYIYNEIAFAKNDNGKLLQFSIFLIFNLQRTRELFVMFLNYHN